MVEIRRASVTDYDLIWAIIQPVIAKGDTYVFDPKSSKEKMINYWCNADRYTYVAMQENKVVGTFFIKDNQPDLGSHIANAGFITSPYATGQGIGTLMGEFAIMEAQRLGYTAMQFNIVIKSNHAAVHLWQKLGFGIIGEIPDAFRHPTNGMTNAYIMYRTL